jgi:ubiquitin carboxyl-terminal hydrolase 7
VEGQFISPTGQLILRAQICPRVVVAGNQHLVSRADVGYIGIRNQGATCYLNSLVQALYHIGDFRKSIFNLTKQSDQAYIQVRCEDLAFYTLLFISKSSSKHSLTKTANYNTLGE